MIRLALAVQSDLPDVGWAHHGAGGGGRTRLSVAVYCHQ